MSKKEDTIELIGKVINVLPNMTFLVELENGMQILAHLCGKMRMRNIRILLGDRVTVEVNAYDLNRGRIVYRHK